MGSYQQYMSPNRGSSLSGGLYAPPRPDVPAYGAQSTGMGAYSWNTPNPTKLRLSDYSPGMGQANNRNPFGLPNYSNSVPKPRHNPYAPPDNSWREGIDERIFAYLDGNGKRLWDAKPALQTGFGRPAGPPPPSMMDQYKSWAQKFQQQLTQYPGSEPDFERMLKAISYQEQPKYGFR